MISNRINSNSHWFKFYNKLCKNKTRSKFKNRRIWKWRLRISVSMMFCRLGKIIPLKFCCWCLRWTIWELIKSKSGNLAFWQDWFFWWLIFWGWKTLFILFRILLGNNQNWCSFFYFIKIFILLFGICYWNSLKILYEKLNNGQNIMHNSFNYDVNII